MPVWLLRQLLLLEISLWNLARNINNEIGIMSSAWVFMCCPLSSRALCCAAAVQRLPSVIKMKNSSDQDQELAVRCPLSDVLVLILHAVQTCILIDYLHLLLVLVLEAERRADNY